MTFKESKANACFGRLVTMWFLRFPKNSGGPLQWGKTNPDEQNRRIASEALFEKAMRNERRREIYLYKKYVSDDDFKSGLHEALMGMMEQVLKAGGNRPAV